MTEDDAAGLVGPNGIREAREFIRRVYGVPDAQFHFRTAPSVICRGEASVFGLDSPRFGIRATVANERCRHSFLTLRLSRVIDARLQFVDWITLKSREQDKPIPWADRHGTTEYVPVPIARRQNPRKAYEGAIKGNHVADCVLVPPSEYRRQYRFLGARLGEQYGELDGNSEGPYDTTPVTSYVRPLSGFGGAACIQGAAFMSSAALADWPVSRADECHSPLMSLGEITYIAATIKKPITEGFIRMKGFGLRVLEKFLDSVGRSAFRHQAAISSNMELVSIFMGHVYSGIPTVLKVSIHRVMRSKSIPDPERYLDKLGHAQVLVGCGTGCMPGSDGSEFPLFVHDPSIEPFVKTKIKQLRRWMHAEADEGPCQFLSVFPAEVKIPLADYLDDSNNPKMGIRSIAATVFGDPKLLHIPWALGYLGISGEQKSNIDRWQLITIQREPGRFLPCDSKVRDACQIIDTTDEGLQQEWENVVDRLGLKDQRRRDRIGWLQSVTSPGTSLQILALWSATDETKETANHLAEHLLFVLVQDRSGNWRVGYENGVFRYDAFPKAPRQRAGIGAWLRDITLQLGRARRELETTAIRVHPRSGTEATEGRNASSTSVAIYAPDLSFRNRPELATTAVDDALDQMHVGLISSFSMDSIADSLRNWPVAASNPCQLYVCGGSDPLLELSKLSDCSPRMLLAHMSKNDQLVFEAADHILKAAQAAPVPVSIRSFATFLPTLNLWRQPNDAVDAVRGLVRLAARLAEASAGHHAVRLIELVGGSVSLGLLPTIETGSPVEESCTYFQKVRDRAGTMRILLRNLQTILSDTSVRALCDKHEIVFGAELEPGPLFVNRGMDSLNMLARFLGDDRFGMLNRYLGLNIDVAHLELAGIEVQDFHQWRKQNPGLRVVGVHVSDHGIGHLADLIPGTMAFGRHDRVGGPAQCERLFKNWLWELALCMAEQSQGPHRALCFEGTIMVEQEAACVTRAAARSVETVERLLKEMRGELRTRLGRQPPPPMPVTN